MVCFFFFFQAEDGIRDLVRSRGLGDVYKRQALFATLQQTAGVKAGIDPTLLVAANTSGGVVGKICLLYTSDAADERSSVDLGGRRIIKKKNNKNTGGRRSSRTQKTRS